jgi:tetratricopeptide (TPR) repeat protein
MFQEKNSYYVVSIAVIFLAMLYSFFKTPIIAFDMDLWYHMDGGRYIVENNQLPRETYFSFIEPTRKYVDYFWLFQVLVYKIHSHFDYYGLIALRALTYSLMMLMTALFLLKAQGEKKSGFAIALIFTLVACIMARRYLNVRPHLFSYLFIVSYLYILEFKPSHVIYLPLLSVLWVNIHGIEYPVMLVLLGAYTAEFFYKRFRAVDSLKKNDLLYIIPIVLSIGAVFVNPNGLELIQVPFISTTYASDYIIEIKQIDFFSVFNFAVSLKDGITSSLFSVILLLTLIALIKAFMTKSVKLIHVFLLIAGAVLLVKAFRFTNEFSLLALPLMARHLDYEIKDNRKIFSILAASILLLFSFLYIKNIFDFTQRYPVSPKGLPLGVTAFLKQAKTTGNILAHPNESGFFRWSLSPQYKILIDMEAPFMFNDEDMYVAVGAFFYEPILKKILEKYQISYICAPLNYGHFEDMIKKFPDYALVFVDDVTALYVNKTLLPHIAESYQINNINPYNLNQIQFSKIQVTIRPPILRELEKIYQAYSDSFIINKGLGVLNLVSGNNATALQYADNMIKNFPEKNQGYMIKAEVFYNQGKYNEALDYFNQSLKLETQMNDINNIRARMFHCYIRLNNIEMAYHFLKKSIPSIYPGIYPDIDVDYHDIYKLGTLALELNKNDEALMLFKFVQIRLPDDDIEMKKRIEEKLAFFE